jgi:hypothetical protein
MSYIAYVRTSGDPLRVRSTPNGVQVDLLANGTQVFVTGNSVVAGGRAWAPIGTNRWVAADFLSTSSGQQEAKVVATRTAQMLGGGLRVYQTQLIDGSGTVINTVRGVSGRVGKQTPSHTAGTQTPLPFGTYKFDQPGRVEYAPGEFGGVWSAVTPTFNTGRSALGIHYDPSAFSYNGNTGTAGCFATPTVNEREIMTRFIRDHKPIYFIVQEGS